MNEDIGLVIGWGVVGIAITIIVFTIVDIHKNLGIGTPRGIFWLLIVLVGSLFGVILYWFFRQRVEGLIWNRTHT